MRIEVMKKGDEVLAVTKEFIAIRRKNREVDILPIVMENALWRIDTEGIVTIGYGENSVTMKFDDGSVITNF